MSLASQNPPDAPGDFCSTQWSVVLQARASGPDGRQALADLCSMYWYPVYVFFRRQGCRADQIEDLTQEFFTRFLDKEFLHAVDPVRGKFRSFLLVCCRNFLANQRDRERAQKRGGGHKTFSIDYSRAAEWYAREPALMESPEKSFERRWALTLLERTLDHVQQEYHLAGDGLLFDLLKTTLMGASANLSYRQIAAELDNTEDAVKKAAQRLRQRYRAVLRAHIGATVDGPDKIDDEIRDLFAALAME